MNLRNNMWNVNWITVSTNTI